MAIQLAPCGWDIMPCGPLPEEDDPSYTELKTAASEVLWALSGRQFGCCEIAIRPCREDCCDPCGTNGTSGFRWLPMLIDGKWHNLSCRACGDSCSCSKVCEVGLIGSVCEIVEVLVDGAVVDPATYRVDNGKWLVRISPNCWPLCQEMGLPPSAPGTWQVKYKEGVPVPSGGKRALGQLMSELWLACKNDAACCLPQRVKTVARQGVSFTMLDPMDFLDHGRTGLYFVDLWLSAVNPLGRPEAARVISPDVPRYREQTWP